MEGVDYSGARPSGLCLYSHGKRFVGRYFGAGNSWKHATRAECAGLIASGLTIVSLVEGALRDPLQGRAKGQEHARLGESAARAAGMPAGRPLYFAVDWDMQPHEAGKVANYFRGCADVIGLDRVGVYGGIRTIDYLGDAGLARWFFQTYAWSDGKWSKRNHFEQYRNHQTVCGGDVDLCRNRKVDFGQWPAPTESIGDAPPTSDDTTVDVGWDWAPHVDNLAQATGQVAEVLNNTARQIDALS